MSTIPSQADLADLLENAQNIASGADQILMQGYGKATPTEKSDGSLVTEIDRAVDTYVTSSLGAAYPQLYRPDGQTVSAGLAGASGPEHPPGGRRDCVVQRRAHWAGSGHRARAAGAGSARR